MFFTAPERFSRSDHYLHCLRVVELFLLEPLPIRRVWIDLLVANIHESCLAVKQVEESETSEGLGLTVIRI